MIVGSSPGPSTAPTPLQRRLGRWLATAARIVALAAVLESIRTHRVTLPGHIAAVVVTTLVLEGWSNRLDPHHSVLAQVQGMFEPQNLGWRERRGAARRHNRQHARARVDGEDPAAAGDPGAKDV